MIQYWSVVDVSLCQNIKNATIACKQVSLGQSVRYPI
uniref:Uncharacterized protein n=1 Tax=Arundo donax TaxID=35708 RepID=A0A0A9BCD0_ARUDO